MAWDTESKAVTHGMIIVEETTATPSELEAVEARRRLIAAAENLDFDTMIFRSPLGATALAFVAGLIIGYFPEVRRATSDGVDTLLRMWLKGTGLMTAQGEVTGFTPEGRARIRERSCL